MGSRHRALASVLLLASCSTRAPSSLPPAPLGVVDLHVDLPHALHVEHRPIDDSTLDASIDRLRRGEVGLIVLPILVPRPEGESPASLRQAYEATRATALAALGSPSARDAFTLPGAPARSGRVATLFSFEGADGFADRPEAIAPWIERGACLFGLVHQLTNGLAGSSQDPDPARRALGLTDAGRAVTRAVYRHGGLVDVAHASDAAFDDIAAIARGFSAPLVDSHTGVRALAPMDRNIDDTRLRVVAASGGVVGIDLHSGHVGREPGTAATLDDVATHIMHAVEVAGIAHVAIGSDLDGGIVPPRDADGEASWPALTRRLEARGLGPRDRAAILHDNAARTVGWSLARGCGKGGARAARSETR